MNPMLNFYCSCLQEVQLRLQLVRSVLDGTFSAKSELLDIEIVYLHLRKILEQLAFASICANKDKYSETYSNFSTHWNADRMLRDLEKINPDFYPTPLVLSAITPLQGVNRHFHFEFLSTGFLTKAEFVDLYNQCGALLHAENPFAIGKRSLPTHVSMTGHVSKIQNLLTFHRVKLIDDSETWVISAPKDGIVHVAQGQAQ